MRKFFGTVLDVRGNPVEDATVTVAEYPGGGNADLFSEPSGSTALANPVSTDDHGYYEFYVAAGRYTLALTTNDETITVNDITVDGDVDLEGSKTFDPGSINAAATESTTVTVTGAAAGDFAIASFSDVATTNADKVTLDAKVTAANTVTVTFRNNHGSAINLAAGTLRVRVLQA